MEVSFASSELAALCNCEARLTQRWGSDTANVICRRLFDLAAVTATTLSHIPGATIQGDADTDETAITFSNGIVIRGVITPSNGHRGTRPPTDHIMIVSIDVQGRDRK
jgi:hypothetical protein